MLVDLIWITLVAVMPGGNEGAEKVVPPVIPAELLILESTSVSFHVISIDPVTFNEEPLNRIFGTTAAVVLFVRHVVYVCVPSAFSGFADEYPKMACVRGAASANVQLVAWPIVWVTVFSGKK